MKDFYSAAKKYVSKHHTYNILACTDGLSSTGNCQMASSYMYHHVTGKKPSIGSCHACMSICNKGVSAELQNNTMVGDATDIM